jgi:ankyrin repeat protein
VHGEAEEATRLLLGRMAALPPAAAAPGALLLARTESIALLLLKAGYAPGQTVGALRETPLQRACRAGAVGVAKVLLEAGAEADAADACRRTALFYAVRAGNLELIQLLLARKVAWSELLEAALKELVAQKPSVGADARAALKRAGLITA